MAWILGIDEAGYGPNLGPFVMTGVACRVPDAGAAPGQRPPAAARRPAGARADRLVVDDSKEVYGNGRGLAGLERGVCATFGELPATLAGLVERLSPGDRDEVTAEAWYTGA